MRTEHQSVSLSVFRGASKGGQDQRDGQTDGQTGWQDEEEGAQEGKGEEKRESRRLFLSLCLFLKRKNSQASNCSSAPLYRMSIYTHLDYSM